MQKYEQLYTEVMELPGAVNHGWLRLNATPLQTAVATLTQKWRMRFLSHLKDKVLNPFRCSSVILPRPDVMLHVFALVSVTKARGSGTRDEVGPICCNMHRGCQGIGLSITPGIDVLQHQQQRHPPGGRGSPWHQLRFRRLRSLRCAMRS